MPPKPVDLIGKEFGRWTVLSYAGPHKDGRGSTWNCRCSCGTERVMRSDSVKKYESCGCFQREKAAETGKTLYLRRRKVPSAVKTHGMTGTKTYRAWNQMIQRCHNEKNPTFERYGAKGIKVCERWRSSFGEFFKDMGTCPSPEHTIDRKDSTKGYYPANCHWLHKSLQSRNRSNVRRFRFQEELLTLIEISDRTGIEATTLRFRLVNMRWSIEKATSTDPKTYHTRRNK